MPSSSDKPALAKSTPKIIVKHWSTAEAGWMSDSNATESFKAQEVRNGDYRDYNLAGNEKAYFDERYIEYTENEWYSFMVEYLTTSLFSDMRFEGEGSEEVSKFFDETCPDALEEIYAMGIDTVRDGTGILLKVRESENNENSKLVQIKYMSVRNVDMEFKSAMEGETEDTGWYADYDDPRGSSEPRFTKIKDNETSAEYYFREYPRRVKEDYRNPRIALCRLRKGHITPWGIPIGKSCFHAIKSLKGVNRDIIAALKKAASNIIVIKYNSSAYGDTDKEEKIEEIGESMEDFEPAASNVLIMDKEHDIGYIANLEGHSGGYDGRLIEVMRHLEPVLSAVLLNFTVALGIVEQTGANKSLIAQQVNEARKEKRRLQRSVATFLKTQIIPEITQKPVDILFENHIETEFLIQLFLGGAVSREFVQKYLGYSDDGKTFAPDIAAKASLQDGMNPNKSNNDDSSKSKQRTGGASRKAGAT